MNIKKIMYANSINQFIDVTYKKLIERQCRDPYGSIHFALDDVKESCTSDSRCKAVASVMDWGCEEGYYQLCFTNQFTNQSNACVYEKIGKL